jgi:hypothetical protein
MPTLGVFESLPEHRGAIVDVAHPRSDVRALFSRPGPFPIGALEWCGDGGPASSAPLVFTVTGHVGWLAADADVEGADPADVVKQVSFLQASEDETVESFRAHYRHHVEVARRHMPSLWQYVQYDVTGASSADPALARTAADFVAVSVLWFRTSDDFLHRYFASEADAAEFRSHEGFLDLSKAFTFVAGVTHAATPTARP